MAVNQRPVLRAYRDDAGSHVSHERLRMPLRPVGNIIALTASTVERRPLINRDQGAEPVARSASNLKFSPMITTAMITAERKLACTREIVDFQRYFVQLRERKMREPRNDILSTLAVANTDEGLSLIHISEPTRPY